MRDFFTAPTFSNALQAQKCLSELCVDAEIENIAYLGISLADQPNDMPTIISTYKQDWVKQYVKQQYVGIDPAIIYGMRGILPYDWASTCYTDKKIRNFFGEANEFGISNNGLSIPIRGAKGDRATFSINSSLSDAEWRNFKTERQADLIVFAYLFHLQIMDTLEDQYKRLEVTLSPREADVLRWAADGKSAWETAKILGLTERTVSFYISNAAVKLRAATKPQAIANAMRIGILS